MNFAKRNQFKKNSSCSSEYWKRESKCSCTGLNLQPIAADKTSLSQQCRPLTAVSETFVQALFFFFSASSYLTTLHHKVSPTSYLHNTATPVLITNKYKCFIVQLGMSCIVSILNWLPKNHTIVIQCIFHHMHCLGYP